jgi:hypothetical protein
MEYTDYIFTFLLLPAIILSLIVAILLICILIQNIIKFNDNRKTKKHSDLISKGFKLFEWKGVRTGFRWYPGFYDAYREPYIVYHEGENYFKSKDDLEKWLNASNISLKWYSEEE